MHARSQTNAWSTLFFRNRRLLLLTICLIAVSGLAALLVLPRMEDPVLTQRAAMINTVYPGATAERVDALVTEKIEDEVQEIEEIKEMRSVSRDGISTISIELQDSVLAREADEVWSRLRDKVNDARPLLPADAQEPRFEKLEISAYALITSIVWTQSDEPSYGILRRLAQELEDQLRAIPGTKEVDLFGDPDEEILVTLQQQEMVQRQLTTSDVAAQLRDSDSKVAAGSQRNDTNQFVMEIDGELDSIVRVRNTPIQFGDRSQVVALGDIATVEKTVRQPPSSLAIIDGKPAVALGILILPTQRVDTWFDDARVVLDAFSKQLPSGTELQIRFEQDTYVRERLASLSWNLLLGATAVVLVIGLMMGWRSAVVVGMTLPMASLMVLTGLNILGIPLHQMSITGLIIALGLLIDNAIVMVDEVVSELRGGASKTEAVGRSVQHLAIPLLGSTLTTAFAFAPIALMPGPAGEFVGSISISVLLAIFSSFFLAMTITPTLGAIISSTERQDGWLANGFQHAALARWYRRTLDSVFARPWSGLAIGLVLPLIGFGLGSTLAEQFFPPAERDQLNVQLELPNTTSLAGTKEVAHQARELLIAHPEVKAVDWYVGESAPSFYYNMLANRRGVSQYAQALLQLKSSENNEQLNQELQRLLDQAFPDARFLVRQLEQGPPFEAPIEIRLFGPNIERLRELGNQVRSVLAATQNVVHTTAELAEARPTLSVQVDQEQARLAGLSQVEVARQLDAALEGAVGGSVLEVTEELPVRVRTNNQVREELAQIASLELLTPLANGPRRIVPLASVAQITLEPKIPAINRFNTRRINEIRGYTLAGTLPAVAQADFQQRWDAAGFRMPDGYELRFAGEASKRNEAIGNLMSSVGILMVLMVATLVLIFSSYRMASIIGLVALLSVGLSLGALAVFGYPFGFMAIVGTMGLIGVAINDTIVVLAAIREDQAARVGEPSAVTRVVFRSTRHVSATTLTTVAGFLPLILEGGGFWPPLAVAIAGGVSGATLLALILSPSVYIMVMCPKWHGAGESDRVASSPVSSARLPVVPVAG